MSQMSSKDDVLAQDVHDLHGLGYAQELLRSMGGFSNFAISFSIISILTGAVILFNTGQFLAGPAAVGIGWPLVTLFTLMIAATMAEIASAYPTAGGLYYWASRLKNKEWGWWTAWLNLGGQISIVAGINFSAAYYLCVTLLNPVFGIDPNLETLGVLNAIWITGALILIEIGFNVAGTRIVAFMNDLSVWWHIFFVAAIAIALFAFGSQPTHDLGFLFTDRGCRYDGGREPDRDDPSVRRRGGLRAEPAPGAVDVHRLRRLGPRRRRDGQRPEGVCLGRLPVGGGLGSGGLHRPDRADPQDDHAGGPAGQQPGRVRGCRTSSAPTWARRSAAWAASWQLGVAFAMTFCGFSSIASAGRMLFAFSRDDGVPGSRWLKKVSHRYRTPANSVIAISVFSWLLIALMYVLVKAFGGDPFFLIFGVTSVSTVLLYWAYAVCIALGMFGDQSWRKVRDLEPRGVEPTPRVAVCHLGHPHHPDLPLPIRVEPGVAPHRRRLPRPAGRSTTSAGRGPASSGPKAQGSEAELSEIEREFSSEAAKFGG